MHLPSVDDYPECNGPRGSQFPYKRQYDDGRGQHPIRRDRLDRRHTSVHDRQGKRVDPQEQLEEEASNRVSNEQPLVCDNEYRYDTEDTSQWWSRRVESIS